MKDCNDDRCDLFQPCERHAMTARNMTSARFADVSRNAWISGSKTRGTLMTTIYKGECDIHRSDGKVTQVLVSETGFPHDLTHCKICGIAMSRPISLNLEPDRFRQYATPVVINYLKKLGLIEVDS